MTPTTASPMMPDAALSGTFVIGGELEVNRLGFGAMRVTGPGIWGEPQDRRQALRTLKRLPEIGVNFIDTADSYGPDVSERLIREALYPYDGLVIATKAGFKRPGPNTWAAHGQPDYLIAQAERSLRISGSIASTCGSSTASTRRCRAKSSSRRSSSFSTAELIRFVGLSEVSVADIEAAAQVFPVATVQNRYNIVDRASEDVLDHCERHGIGFIPWYPLGAGDLAKSGSALAKVARRHGATPGQIALAWLLKRSPVMLPIPGTSKVAHLEENVAAAAIELSDDDLADLKHAG